MIWIRLRFSNDLNYGNAQLMVLDSDTQLDWMNKEMTDWVKKTLKMPKMQMGKTGSNLINPVV